MRLKGMETLRTYRAALAALMLISAAVAAAALSGWIAPTAGAESAGEPPIRIERALALKVVGQRLGGELPEGLRVSALGSRMPMTLSRPLTLMFDDANRMAGWVESLQRGVYRLMGDTIESLSLDEVTEAEAAARPFAFAVGERWFALEGVALRHFGRVDLSRTGPVRDIAAKTACRFMTKVSATPASGCFATDQGAVEIARR